MKILMLILLLALPSFGGDLKSWTIEVTVKTNSDKVVVSGAPEHIKNIMIAMLNQQGFDQCRIRFFQKMGNGRIESAYSCEVKAGYYRMLLPNGDGAGEPSAVVAEKSAASAVEKILNVVGVSRAKE